MADDPLWERKDVWGQVALGSPRKGTSLDSLPGPPGPEGRNRHCSVTVVVPALNEADAIGQVVADLVARYPQYEILVVDDGSADETGQLAESAGARVIRHAWNKGYGASLRTGCRQARGETIVCFDGDGQHDAGDVERLVDEIGPHDMVVGTRSRDSLRAAGPSAGQVRPRRLRQLPGGREDPRRQFRLPRVQTQRDPAVSPSHALRLLFLDDQHVRDAQERPAR